MKVVILGLWHLGCVTAACVAKFEQVVGLDFDPANITRLKNGTPPIFEPGLEQLLAAGVNTGRLSFTDDPRSACQDAELLWICIDTPVDEQDRVDLVPLEESIAKCAPFLKPGTMILISSQIPAGTSRFLEQKYPNFRFAYSPENLRLGKAIEIFLKADRVILGVRTLKDADELTPLLRHFTDRIVPVRTESAEMIKHGINSFLALSISFMNELSRICERVGADAKELELGLKSEARIGPRAYLSAGGPFSGGTLARDVVALTEIGDAVHERLVLIPAIKASNDTHKNWTEAKLIEELKDLAGRKITILGLTYKPNTDTLRRSLAVEICRSLMAKGARIQAYDPAIQGIPANLAISLASSIDEAVTHADAIVICTEWPAFRRVAWANILRAMAQPIVIDANGFLSENLSTFPGIVYRQVGKPREERVFA
ncbi:MAG: UDP-glucose/GDP-mannose dehydrogenase family protein [Verrucomicrobia bacterium]|nr:UDP-glucose/GDP-mannose dehydrogenase family protein [Verrucomicrobiota bacterium]